MQHVLIVDDSAEIRKLLIDAFESFSHKFKTLSAKNGKEAADIVSKQQIDLVVTDTQMPVMDGMELIEFIEVHQPGIPIFIIAPTLTPEVDKKISSSDAIKFFSKPFSAKALADDVYEELIKSSGGEMHGVSIPSFLQLMEMEKRTCTLLVREGEKSGQFLLRKGVPVDAHVDDLSGDAAACEIISWDKATVQVRGGDDQAQTVIKTPLMALIIEATRLKDERANSEKEQHHTKDNAKQTVSLEDSVADDVIEREKAMLPPGVIDFLNASNEVNEYRIFNKDDFVLKKSENVDSALKVVPSDYFDIADELSSQIASGEMSFFQIDACNGTRYIFLKYFNTRLVLSVNQKLQPERLLKKLSEFSPDVRAEV